MSENRYKPSRLDPIGIMPEIRYKPLPLEGIGKVPLAPPVPFDPEACEKYPIPPQGDRGVLGPGPVEITIYRTPDRHWVKHVGEYVVQFDPSGHSETVYAECYEEMPEPAAIHEVRAAGFEMPPRPGPPAGSLVRTNAKPREIPQNAVKCSQAQVARFLKQAERGGLIELLEKQGDLEWQTKSGGKFWVVFASKNQHDKFQAFVKAELQERQAKRKKRSRI